jgi:hypothetical protein
MASIHWPSRLRAASAHLFLSGLVAAIAAALVFLVWYPGYFSKLAGGAGLFILITSVDVALGPVITLAVFDRSKPRRELVRDLAIVAALQLGALAYGLHTMYIVRPVAMALEDDRFRVVAAVDVLFDELPQAPEGLRSLPLTGPRLVGTAPILPAEKFDAIKLAMGGYDIGTRPKYWRPWAETGRQQAVKHAKPLSELSKRFPERHAELNAAVARTGVPLEHLRYLPVISLHAQAIALIDMRSGDIAGYAGFDAF